MHLLGRRTHLVAWAASQWRPGLQMLWSSAATMSSTAACSSSDALVSHLKAKIMMRGGPLSVAEYMQDVLTSPQGGFYMNRDVFGTSGDFITSPEITQLFGEMVGIWAVHTWMTMGSPPRLSLVELGPGRGTLMADLLRSTAGFKSFAAALDVHLVEVSPALRKLQWHALACKGSFEDAAATAEAAYHLSKGSSSASTLLNNDMAGGGTGGSSTFDSHGKLMPERPELLPDGHLLPQTTAAAANTRSSSNSSNSRSAGRGGAGLIDLKGVPLHADDNVLSGRAGAGQQLNIGSISSSANKGADGPDSSKIHSITGQSALNGCQVFWHPSLQAVPRDTPALYIAHEFFDALPVHQFVKDPQRGWLEKMVDVGEGPEPVGPLALTSGQQEDVPSSSLERGDHSSRNDGDSGAPAADGSSGGAHPSTPPVPDANAAAVPHTAVALTSKAGAELDASIDGERSRSNDTIASDSGSRAAEAGVLDVTSHHLRMVLSPTRTPASTLLVQRRLAGLEEEQKAELKALEVSGVGMAAAEQLALRIGQHGGAALIIDYGKDGPYADSLMAIRGHKGVGVLDQPGTADLSAWVDFASLKQAAQGSGADVVAAGPVPQSYFLRTLGIETRLQQLTQKATTEGARAELKAGVERVLDEGEQGMGRSYQVMVLLHDSLRHERPAGF